MNATRMRAGIMVAVAAVSLGVAPPAMANGGAYIVMDKTYYLPDDTAVATAQVAIPDKQRDLLAAGPFHAYALAPNVVLRAGDPLPSGGLRLGTFDVTEKNGIHTFVARFTMPALEPGVHTIAMCNDPCTITGFSEPLAGSFELVETAREIELLKANGALRGQVYRGRREVQKLEKTMDEVEVQLASAEAGRSALQETVVELESQLEASEALVASESVRPIVHPTAAAAVCAALVVLSIAIVRRPWVKRRSKAVERLPEVAG